MIYVTCRLTAKNRDQLRNPTLGNRVWATFTFLLEYCAPWHYALTKAQPESLEAVQKRAIHITHNLTRGMPCSSMLLHVNLDSLAARIEDLSRRFFRNIRPMDPASCLHSLLPSPRSTAITSRLRSSQIFPKVHTRTKRYCSFIQYGLNHYQYA